MSNRAYVVLALAMDRSWELAGDRGTVETPHCKRATTEFRIVAFASSPHPSKENDQFEYFRRDMERDHRNTYWQIRSCH
jgi:hypothetical protein